MPLGWNEIRTRAVAFSKEHAPDVREQAEAQSFWNDFFYVFGVARRRVAIFEAPVKNLVGAKRGRIVLFWKGVLLVEGKSKGKDLYDAAAQARDYFPGLSDEELPQYILVSALQRFELYDLDVDPHTPRTFTLAELHKNVELFGFIAGYQRREFRDQDPANIEASERMGKLHDMLKDSGYEGPNLDLLLVRMLFCLFADDTSIFDRDSFRYFLEDRTSVDGNDVGAESSSCFNGPNLFGGVSFDVRRHKIRG